MEEVKKTQPSKEEYINAQRIAAGVAFGPVPELYNTLDWIAEYDKIQQKKSGLSARKRKIVQDTIDSATEKYEQDKLNGNTERFDNLQKVVDKFLKFVQTLEQVHQNNAI